MNTHHMFAKLKIKKGVDPLINEPEGEFIYQFLLQKKIKKTLEIGFGYGYSTAYIIAATKHKHYVIDAFQANFKNIGLKNIKQLGFDKYLVFLNEWSHSALPKLLSAGKKFDFAFIDGGHRFDGIFIDFYYIDLLLNQNGYVLFHDNWLYSTQLVVSWIKTNKKNYHLIKTPEPNSVLFQKRGEYIRYWDHFNDFHIPFVEIYPRNRQPLILTHITGILNWLREKIAFRTRIKKLLSYKYQQ